MGLMASLFIGVSGLQTSQNSLNTTAHNLSNVDTKGYTRQTILQTDRTYEMLSREVGNVCYKQTGLGVVYAKTRQVRDHFLDETYRRENGRSAFYNANYTVMTEVETLLGELYGAEFNDSMKGLQESMEELAKTPCDSVVQGLVVQRAAAFVESAQAVYSGLCDYQDNLNLQIKNQVDTINKYGQRIHALNLQISKIEASNLEEANDLRDARNMLVDELSEMVAVSYTEDLYGNMLVRLEGHDFVLRDMVYEMGVQPDKSTGFFTPFWVVDADYTIDDMGNKIYNTEGAEVFNMKQTISPEWNTDVGGLKAMVFARGDHRGTFEDLKDSKTYNDGISQSILMNIQGEFDSLVNTIVTRINDILYNAASQDPDHPYNCKEINEYGDISHQPILLFSKKGSADMIKGYDPETNRQIWVPATRENDPKGTVLSVMNITVNPDLVKSPTMLGLRKEDGKEDQITASALAKAFQEEKYTLNPNANMKFNPVDFYNGIVAQIANSGNVYKTFVESQQDTVEATYSNREQLLGVSSDDELAQMIKFQNAYNASSRYINVVNEMLAHLLNALAG